MPMALPAMRRSATWGMGAVTPGPSGSRHVRSRVMGDVVQERMTVRATRS